jgi:hypothetical protein
LELNKGEGKEVPKHPKLYVKAEGIGKGLYKEESKKDS